MQASLADCPIPEVLQKYLLGQLPSDQARCWDDHILGCSSCSGQAIQWESQGALLAIKETVIDVNDREIVERVNEWIPDFLLAYAPAIHGEDKKDNSAPDLLKAEIPGYVIDAELGRGGMGIVYRARQLGIRDGKPLRTVAIKVLLSGAHASRKELDRFRHEAEAIARLRHPNIVQIHSVGEHNGLPFLALEYCEGGSLDRAERGTPKPPLEAAEFVKTLCGAVHSAHLQGIIHRDLKPANILLTADGRPKVSDFGLAKDLESRDDGHTATGAIMGSPSYMAPEQASGLTKHAGPAVDTYALGAILYELLTGRPPFKAETRVETMRQVLEIEPASLRSLNSLVPADLETICLKCLEKDPATRYSSAEELRSELDRFLRGEPISARPIHSVTRIWRWCCRHPAQSISIASLLLILLGAAIVSTIVAARMTRLARSETEARELAVASQTQADQKAKEALFSAESLERENYRHIVARAYTEWQENDVQAAVRLLDRCPVALRGWEWHYCKRLCHQGERTFTGHKANVAAVAFHPDGQLIASADETGIIKVWEASTGAERFSFRTSLSSQYRDRFSFLTFSPDGANLASAAEDGTVRIWSMQQGNEVSKIENLGEYVCNLQYSPDGQQLAVACRNSPARICNLASGKVVKQLSPGSAVILDITFSPDGKTIATSDSHGQICIWSGDMTQPLKTLVGHEGSIPCVRFSPDGKTLASASLDKTIRLWDLETETQKACMHGHAGFVNQIRFSRDGTRLVSCGRDRGIKIWNAKSGLELQVVRGHRGPVRGVCFSPDRQMLASCADDETVRLWRLDSDQSFQKLKTGRKEYAPVWVRALKFAPDSRHLVTGAVDLRVHDLSASRQLLHNFPIFWPFSVDFNADGSRMLVTGYDSVVVWDCDRHREIVRIIRQVKTISQRGCARFSPDGKQFTFASFKDVVTADTETGKELVQYHGHVNDVQALAYSADGETVASMSSEGMVRVWHPRTGRDYFAKASAMQPFLWQYTKAVGVPLAFSPSGVLAVGGGVLKRSGEVQIWDGRTGRTLQTLRDHSDVVHAVTFDPTGSRLLAGCNDGTLKIWDPVTGSEMFQLHDESGIICLDVSKNGHLIAAGGVAQAARVWDGTPIGDDQLAAGATSTSRTLFQSTDELTGLSKSEHPHANLEVTKAMAMPRPAPWMQVLSPSVTSKKQEIPEAYRSILRTRACSLAAVRIPEREFRFPIKHLAHLQGWVISHGENTHLKFWNPETGETRIRYRIDYYSPKALGVAENANCLLLPEGAELFVHDFRLRQSRGMPGLSTLKTLWVDPDCKQAYGLLTNHRLLQWELSGHKDPREICDFSANASVSIVIEPKIKLGLMAAAPEAVGSFVLWDVGNGKPMRTLDASANRWRPFAISDDGVRALAAQLVPPSGRGKLILWDLENGKILRTFDTFGLDCVSASFGHDRERIVATFEDNTVRIFHAVSGAELDRIDFGAVGEKLSSMALSTGRLIIGTEKGVIFYFHLG